MKKLGDHYEIVDESLVKPRSNLEMIGGSEPFAALGVRRSFAQLSLASEADSLFGTEASCFDLNDQLTPFADGEGSRKFRPNCGALQTVSYEQILAISLLTEARLSLISNRIRSKIDQEGQEGNKTPF